MAKIPKPPKSAAETRAILKKLEGQHPGADTELHYTTPYELLVATILSAQSTDVTVNKVTPNPSIERTAGCDVRNRTLAASYSSGTL